MIPQNVAHKFVPGFAPEYEICLVCMGTGNEHDFSGESPGDCSKCNGTGRVPIVYADYAKKMLEIEAANDAAARDRSHG